MLRPVEFRTQLRLQQARRLMLSEDLDAASAGFEVGYSSPSQFSREYRRIFGVPRRSIRRNSAMCTFPIFSSRAALRRDPRQCIERCVKVGVMAGSCRDLGLAETFPYISRG
ncbi:AraC family transcriptional regulator [Rhizobium croatiense]|nr:AraC family transcriptional regulator [Rhizobium croatiense]WET76085.1 AraC family transcriptional regulator [Rhizobium croatiense]